MRSLVTVTELLNNIKKMIRIRDYPTPLGRWGLKLSEKQVVHRIECANEDHCGPCGQYNYDTKVMNNQYSKKKRNKI